jgi:hypothetical protein
MEFLRSTATFVRLTQGRITRKELTSTARQSYCGADE